MKKKTALTRQQKVYKTVLHFVMRFVSDVLTYHVISGTYWSASLSNGMMPKTVEGKPVNVKIDDGTLRRFTSSDVLSEGSKECGSNMRLIEF